MPPSSHQRLTVLVVQEEDVFSELLQHFPPSRYELLFAASAPDALSLCSVRSPHLLIVPAGDNDRDLVCALREATSSDIPFLGIASAVEESGGGLDLPGLLDRVVPRADLAGVLASMRQMLQERRFHPRVNVEFSLTLGEGHAGVVRDLSATSLLVYTDAPLESGGSVELELGWGRSPMRFSARVGRVRPELLGQSAVVLHVPDDAADARCYLGQLVSRILDVKHYLAGIGTGPGRLRGPVAWKLARRAEDSLREHEEVAQAASQRALGSLPRQGTELESRYLLDKRVGQWGVGQVHAATHRLLRRPVTLKVLRPDLHQDGPARERMEQEAWAACMVPCPGIVDVLDFGTDGRGGLYYTMESLRGETLAQLMSREQTISARDVACLGLHVASALTTAHLRGVGHYDLCPESIYLRRQLGASWHPVLVNLAGTPPGPADTDTHAMGRACRPPEAPQVLSPTQYDIHALGAILDTLLMSGPDSPAFHIPDKEASEGLWKLTETVRLARAVSPAERIPDMATVAEALSECLALLEAEASPMEPSLIEPLPYSRPRQATYQTSRAPLLQTRQEGDAPPGSSLALDMSAPTLKDLDTSAPTLKDLEDAPTLREQAPAEEDGDQTPFVLQAEDFLAAPEITEDLARADMRLGPPPLPPQGSVPGRRTRRRVVLMAGVALGGALVTILVLVVLFGRGDGSSLAPGQTPSPASRATGDAGKGRAASAAGASSRSAAGLAARPSGTDPDGGRSVATRSARATRTSVGGGPSAAANSASAEPGTGPDEKPPAPRPATEPLEKEAEAAGRADEAAGSVPRLARARDELERRRWRHVKRARELMSRGKYDQTRQQLTRALRIRDSSGLRQLFAQTYEKSGRHWPAVYHMKRAIRLDPRVAWFRDKLGRFYLALGKAKKACKAFRAALAIKRGYGLARRHIEKHCK